MEVLHQWACKWLSSLEHLHQWRLEVLARSLRLRLLEDLRQEPLSLRLRLLEDLLGFAMLGLHQGRLQAILQTMRCGMRS